MIESSIANAFDALWAKSSERNWIYGRLGRPNGSGTLYDVPGQPGYKYVMKGSEGTEGLVTAIDRIGVAAVANQRVKMRREYGHLVIREAEQLAGGSGSGSNTLAGLFDVSLTSLADGNTLQYSASASKWVNVVPAGGAGASNLNALTDVTLSSVANLNYLIYNSGSSQWINAVPSHGDLAPSSITPDQHHAQHHDIVGGDHFVTGSAFQLVGATATNTLGLLTPSSNPGSAAAILRTDPSGAITIGGGMFVVTPSTHQVTIDGTTFAVDTSLDTLTIGGATTFNNNAVFNNPTRFNALATFNTNLTFVTADRTITSDAGIDITWDLGTSGTPGDLILASPKRFRSADFLDDIPIAGFGLLINSANDRQLTINTIKSDSLHTRLFVADGVRIDIGEERWGKSMGIVHDDFTTPAAIGGTVPVYFENSPILTGALFSNNDWVLLRYLNNAATFAYGSVWGQVTAYTDMGLDADRRGYQRWTFTMRHGDFSTLIKKGNVAIDYGVSGQGYVYLSTLGDANGPWFRIGTWSGSDPFTAGNTQIRTQIGRLDGIADAALNPTGYGLYSDNAYLHGMVRTAETVMDDDGLALEYNNVTDPNAIFGAHSVIAWWPNVDSRIGNPAASVAAAKDISVPANHSDTLFLHAWKAADSYNATVSLKAVNPSDVTYGGSAIVLDTLGNMQFQSAQMQFFGHALPVTDITYDLGAASLRWRTLYVHTLTADTITGAALGGQTWTYPASMTIDAVSSGPTVVSVTNSGVGAASLDVEANITLGGTIDGVDLSAHVADPNAHHHIAQTGDGITVVPATQVVAVDGTVVRTPATVVRNTFTITPTAPLTGGGTLATSPMSLGLNIATPSGLTITGGLAVADALAGTGLTMTAKVLAVNFALVPHANTQMIAGAGLTGGGDLSANRTFDVIAGDASLIVNADELHVNRAFNFAWTGNHTFSTGAIQFNTDPQLASNLDFIGTERSITSPAATNINIVPGGDLVLYPTGLDVFPGSSGLINLGGYNRKWSTLYASELYVETLVASNVMATIGGRVMITPTSSLIADFPIGATTIDLKHGTFAKNTWLYLENIVSGVPQNEAIKVDPAPTTNPTTITGGFRYAVLRGTGAPYTSVGPRNWVVGDAVVSLGAAVNDGYIDQASLQTIHTKVGPTITIYSRTATTNWNDTAPVVSMGNLNGFAGLGSVYGFAAGNNLTLAPSTGFSGFTADAIGGLKMYNTPIVLYNGPNKVISITKEDGVQFDNDTSVGTPAWLRWYADLDSVTSTNAIASITTGYAGVSGTATLNIRAGAGGTAGHNGQIQMSVDDNVNSYTSYLSMTDYRLVNTAGNFNFIVLYGGNVGLGTSTPGQILDVARATNAANRILMRNSTVGTLAQALFEADADTSRLQMSAASSGYTGGGGVAANDCYVQAVSGALLLRTTGVNPVRFGINATEVARFDTNGNFGIGTGSPNYLVEAVSSGNFATRVAVRNSTAGTVSQALFQAAADVATVQFGATSSTYTPTLGMAASEAFVQANPGSLHLRTILASPIRFTTNAVEVMRIDAAGNVGIGNTAPASMLDVAGTMRSTSSGTPASGVGLEMLYNTASAYGQVLAYDRSAAVYKALRLDGLTLAINSGSGGNVGIGQAVPVRLLHVGGGTGGPTQTYEGVYVNPATAQTQISARNTSGVEVGMFAHSNSNAYIGTWTNFPLNIRTNNVDQVTIDTSGRVGIGVTPAFILDILQSSNAANRVVMKNLTVGTAAQSLFQAQSDTASFQFAATSSGYTGGSGINAGDCYVQANPAALVFKTVGAFPIRFVPNSSEAARFDSAGKLGVNTTTPGAQLDVAGVIRTTDSAAAPATGTGVQIYYNTTSSFGSISAYNAAGTPPTAFQELRIDGNILKLNASSNYPVGVATPSPLGQLGVETTSINTATVHGISSTIYSNTFGAFINQAHIVARSARGTKGGTLTGTLASDNIFALEAYGSTSANAFMTAPSFAMYVRATQAYNNGQVNGGAALDIYLRPDGIAGNPTNPVLTIDQNGNGTFFGNLTINNKRTTDPPGGQLAILNMWSTTATGTLAYVTSGSSPNAVHTIIKSSASSRRFKKQIRTLAPEFGTDFIMRLAPSIFKYIGPDDEPVAGFIPDPIQDEHIGLIAEEVLAAGGKEYVIVDGDGQPEGLRYELFAAPLIAAFQQQQGRIIELERRLAELERKLAA